MSTPTRVKQPLEIKTLSFDFSAKLMPGETLLAPIVVDVEGLGLTTAPPALDSPYVAVQVEGGAPNANHRLSVRAPTSNGNVLELDVIVQVREGVN
jgi:hypothetical protein